MHKRFFEYDPQLRRTTWLVHDDDGNFRGCMVEQEIDEILEANAVAEKATLGQRFGEWQKVASVPLTLMEKTGLGDAIAARDKRFISKLLNDPDYRKLRTSRGNA